MDNKNYVSPDIEIVEIKVEDVMDASLPEVPFGQSALDDETVE